MGFFVFLLLFSLLGLLVSVFHPTLVGKLLNKDISRKGSSLLMGFLALASLIIIGATATPTQTSNSLNSDKKVEGISTQNNVSIPSTNSIDSSQIASSTPTLKPSSTPTLKPTPTSTPSNNDLSNDTTYINSQGNTVHSPAYSNSIPLGASAICGDGTYSFSQNRRGTCSHHGGVSQWL
jgi:hypothetical protein